MIKHLHTMCGTNHYLKKQYKMQLFQTVGMKQMYLLYQYGRVKVHQRSSHLHINMSTFHSHMANKSLYFIQT